jgi:trimethylamine--corrinoid protein Co-methyltransferase
MPSSAAVSAPSRTEDCIQMAKILFGERWMNAETGEPNTLPAGVMNGNSPLTYRRHHAGRGQGARACQSGVRW